MGYIEDYFHKRPEDIRECDVQEFINQGIVENLHLEYKGFDVYDRRETISKTISSFANSAGGLFILGVGEKGNLPDSITWGNIIRSNKETLENRILSDIFPKIDGLRILPVIKESIPGEGIFLIDVPIGSNPPYMAGDNKYYKRHNFQKQPMEGYEVADFFNRRKSPRLTINPDVLTNLKMVDDTAVVDWVIKLKNTGNTLARDVFCIFDISNVNVEHVQPPFKEKRVQEHQYEVSYLAVEQQILPLYPHPRFERNIGYMRLGLLRTPRGVYQADVRYQIMSENMPLIDGSLSIVVSQDLGPADIQNHIEKAVYQ